MESKMPLPLEMCESFTLHEGTVNDILYIPEGDAFITTSEDSTIRLWVEDSAGKWSSTESQQLRVIPSALAWDGCRQWVRRVEHYYSRTVRQLL